MTFKILKYIFEIVYLIQVFPKHSKFLKEYFFLIKNYISCSQLRKIEDFAKNNDTNVNGKPIMMLFHITLRVGNKIKLSDEATSFQRTTVNNRRTLKFNNVVVFFLLTIYSVPLVGRILFA